MKKIDNASFSIERLLQTAIEKNADVGMMEKLLSMRKQLKEEWAKETFFTSLSSLQRELPILKKNSIVRNKDGTVRYAYTPLEEIVRQTKDIIQKYGFSFLIDSEVKEKSVKAVCKIIHQFGHSETSTFEVPIDKDGFMNEPQKFASALTYAKRYAFCNAFGILTADEDDDTSKTHPIREDTPPIETTCTICGAPAVKKTGTAKNGKAWQAIFCSAKKEHIQWLN